MYFRKKTSGGRAYLQIVKSRREGATVRQQVISTLGRLDALRQSGQLERLLRSGARFADKPVFAGSFREGEATTSVGRRIGPALVFEKLWTEMGCRASVEDIARSAHHVFSAERTVFLAVLNRLFSAGAADRIPVGHHVEDIDGPSHLYRSLAWLGERVGSDEQVGASPFASHCLKDVVEEDLFARRQSPYIINHVFTELTYLVIEPAGGPRLDRTFSKGLQPAPPRPVFAVLFDGKGWPVGTEIWPGATVDAGSVISVIDRLRRRFSIGRVCIVADHNRVSVDLIEELDAHELHYVIAVDERGLEILLDDSEAYIPSFLTDWNEGSAYETKSVTLDGHRYVVCLDAQRPSPASRAATLAALEHQLRNGDATLVTAMGYRPFVTMDNDGHPTIDHGKAATEAKFDGAVVLRTNLNLQPPEVMLLYERARSVGLLFCGITPVYTRSYFRTMDETICGQMMCSFLALMLKKELERRIAVLPTADGEAMPSASWPQILAALESLTEIEVEQAGKRFLLRSAPSPAASLAMRAAGVALPPTVRPLGNAGPI